MLNIIFLLICIWDGIFISKILNAIFKEFFHNSTIFRVLKVFCGIPLGILYAFFAFSVGESDSSLVFGIFVVFGPFILILLLYIWNYIKNVN